jgi:hypothetical protein
MKLQDIVFVLVFVVLVLLRKERVILLFGIICLMTATALYVSWIFFTAQRLVMYGIAFIFTSLIFSLFRKSKLQ